MGNGMLGPRPLGLRPNYADPLGRGLVGWWPLQEQGGSGVYDVGGLPHHGTLGGFDLPVAWSGSVLGGGLEFAGTDDVVTIPFRSTLNVSQLSISLWIRPTLGALASLVEIGNSNNAGYGFFINATGQVGHILDTANGDQNGAAVDAVPAGVWSHVGMTYNGEVDGDQVYVNGRGYTPQAVVSIGRQNLGGAIDPSTSALTFGSRIGTSLFYTGGMSNVRVYNRDIGPQQMRRLYTEPWAGACVPARALPRLVPAPSTGTLSPGHTYQHRAWARHRVSHT